VRKLYPREHILKLAVENFLQNNEMRMEFTLRNV